MATKIYTKTGDKGSTSLIGGTKVPKSHLRIEAYGTVDELNSFVGLLGDQLGVAGSHLSALARLDRNTHNRATRIADNPNTPAAAPNHHTKTAGNSKNLAAPSKGAEDPDQVTSHHTKPADTTDDPGQTPGVLELSHIRGNLLEVQDRLFTIGSSLACDPEKEPKLRIPDLTEEDLADLESAIDHMEAILPPMKSFLLPGGHTAISTAHIVRCVCRRAERSCVRMQEEQLPVEPLVLRYLNRLSDYFFVLARYIGHLLNVKEIPWKPRL